MAHDFTLTDKDIINCCGQTMFERGLEYYRQGRVKNVAVFGNKVKSKVVGSARYSVQIEIDNKNIYGECTCPVGDSCKHVAATLFFLKNKRNSVAKIDDIASYLNSLPKEDLVRLIVNTPSDAMFKSIKLDMASQKKSKIDTEAYKEEIDTTLEFGHYFDYGDTFGLIEDLKGLKASLEKLVTGGFYNEACYLLLHFLRGCIRKEEECDDSNGDLGELAIDIGTVLAKALRGAKVDDIMLQELVWMHKDAADYGLEGAIHSAIKGLDKNNLKMIERLAKARKESTFKWLHREAIKAQGKLDDYVRLCCESKDYLEAVNGLVEAGRTKEAIRLAQTKADGHIAVQERLFELLVERKNYPEALVCAWKLFVHSPWDEYFENIKDMASKLSRWKSEKAKVVKYLERTQDNNDLLVLLCIENGDLNLALKNMKDIEEETSAKLATALESEMPDIAIGIYKKLAEHHIERMGNEHYKTAAKYLSRMKNTYKNSGASEVWKDYIQKLRETHKPKRNLIAQIARL